MSEPIPVEPDTLSEQDIIARVNSKAKECVGWYDSRLSQERMRVLEYYNALLPRRQNPGSSTYISTDVYDSVEMMKAQLLEVFAGGDDIFSFDPTPAMDMETCREATEACRYVFFHENEGFKICNDVIHDGLTARVGIAKVYWEEKFDYVDEEFHNLDYGTAQALAAQEHVVEFEGEHNEETGLFDGTLQKKVDRSFVRIDIIAPEEFLIQPRAVTLQRSGFSAHRTLKTKDELLRMGLDRKKVLSVHYDDSMGLDLSPEVLARNAPVETVQALDNPIQPLMEQVMLYESYVRMQIDKKKGIRLYKILHTSDVMFEYQEVDKTPFYPYVPLPVPHMFYGNNFAQRCIPVQNARTILTRSVLDHSTITTNPRWQVVKGGLPNPREMIDNRIGGLVNVARENTITPLVVPPLNPFVFQVMQSLKTDKEQSTGISELSQGLNKDAISQQNSAALVDNLVQLSGIRQKISARHFAYSFFMPVMLEIVRLLVLNENKTKLIQVAGNWKQVDPTKWEAPVAATMAMHLGYGEKETHLKKLMTAYSGMAQDPALQNMFGPQGRYNLLMDAAKVGGLTNMSAYLQDPKSVPPPQPDPLKVQDLKIKDKSATAQLITATAQAQADKARVGLDAAKIKQGDIKLTLEALDHDRTHVRQDIETASRIDQGHRGGLIDERQMALDERMRPAELAAQREAAARQAAARAASQGPPQ